MAWFEWTQRVPSTGDGGIYFFERTPRGLPVSPPLNRAIVDSWVVGGGRGGGPVMASVVSLPIESFRVNGIPVYYDPSQDIWFVNGYPENFTSAADAAAFAESLVPNGGNGGLPPVGSVPLAPILGIAALFLLVV